MINNLITQNVTQGRSKSLIAIGSNVGSALGDPRETVLRAVVKLKDAGLVIRCQSRVYRAPAFPAGSGPDFANAAVVVSHDDAPAEILKVLHKIEENMGRERRERWGPRVIDLDLLATDDSVLPSSETQADWMNLAPRQQTRLAPEELILPHPRLHERAFVLIPLAEVAPDWRHPILGQTVSQMRELLSEDLTRGIVLYQ